MGLRAVNRANISILKIQVMKSQVLLKAIVLFALPAMLFFAACDPTAIVGEGGLITENRNIDDFDRLDISIPGEVHVTKGQTFKVVVKAEETLMPFLETELHAGKLHIYFSHNVRDVDGLEVEITMPELNQVQVSGSAHLHTDGVFSGSDLDLGLSGSGRIHMDDIDFEDISANVSGSGSLELQGVADAINAQVSGSGKIDAVQCPAQTAEAHVSGSGEIRLQVVKMLKAYVSGSGNVWYEGNPAVEEHLSGSGRVRKL